jgi:DNA-binding NarL/FixJ family response regulator
MGSPLLATARAGARCAYGTFDTRPPRPVVAMTVGTTEPVRVAIADRRRLIAEALAVLIGTADRFVVTGAVTGAVSTDSAVTALVEQRPDVVVIGVGADPRQALELARGLRSRIPTAEIVIVADVLEPDLVGFVLDHSIPGLLLTDASGAEIADCLDQVRRGKAVLPTGWQRALVAGRNDPLELLSERQMQVLELLAEGCSYEEIGTRLFISLNTVKFHVRSIFLRLGVRNRMAAARLLTGRRRSMTPSK